MLIESSNRSEDHPKQKVQSNKRPATPPGLPVLAFPTIVIVAFGSDLKKKTAPYGVLNFGQIQLCLYGEGEEIFPGFNVIEPTKEIETETTALQCSRVRTWIQ